MKRIAALLSFLCVFLYNGFAAGVRADAAAASVVIEESTGRTLHQMNAHAPLPMASTTKVMTALVAIERCALSEVVTCGENAFGVPGTSIYLEKGETLTLEQMLYGLMLASGNDAAVAIAEHVGGSVQGFCGMMNEKAAALGCENTCFTTPHGLPAQGHYTTAADLALIAREAMRSPIFRKIVSTQRMTIPWVNHPYDRVLTNKNRLLGSYAGALGIKTGYTKAAGRCLVFAAERGGMTVIGVVLACPDWFDQAQILLDNAFSDYEMARAYEKGAVIARLAVSGGTRDAVDVVTEGEAAAPVPRGTITRTQLTLPDVLEAGFAQGERVGAATLYAGDEALITVPLVTKEGVPRATFHTGLRRAAERWLLLSN